MTRTKPFTFLATAAVIPLAALAAAGCGGGGGGATAATAHPKTAAPRSATVKVANSRLGKILVDSRGRTLYLFTKDSGTKSRCTGACASAWQPLRANKPTVGSGANASMVGTTRRSDGKAQVTYNGHPLYLFVKDQKPGDTNGEGLTAFGGSWFVLSPTGNRISKSGSGSSSSQPAAPAAPKPKPKSGSGSSSSQPAAPAGPAAPKPKPAAKPKANIPQNGGGDGDADNNGGPDDGDGGI